MKNAFGDVAEDVDVLFFLHRRGGVHHGMEAAGVIEGALLIHARGRTQIFLQPQNGGTRAAQQSLAETLGFLVKPSGFHHPADDALRHGALRMDKVREIGHPENGVAVENCLQHPSVLLE